LAIDRTRIKAEHDRLDVAVTRDDEVHRRIEAASRYVFADAESLAIEARLTLKAQQRVGHHFVLDPHFVLFR